MIYINLKNKINNSKGITLVAMVISIIVLLILATVSINLIINNGILDKAKYAVDKYSEEEELEQIKLAVLSAQIKNNGTLTTENLNKELQSNFNDNEIIAEKIGGNWYYNGYCIDENGNVEKYNKLLPKEYQQVEYIESTGTQYIITDIIPKNTMGIYVKVATNDVVNNSNIIGAKGKDNSRFFVSIKEKTANYGWNDFLKTNLSVSSNVIHTLELNYNNSRVGMFDNEVTFTITDNLSQNATRPMYIFTVNWEGNTNGNSIIKLYELKLTEEVTIKYNFIPCYNKNSGVIGLYDTVNGQFYVNQGSGTFEKGNDV